MYLSTSPTVSIRARSLGSISMPNRSSRAATSSMTSIESRMRASSRASGRTRSRRTERAPAIASARPSRIGRVREVSEVRTDDRMGAELREHIPSRVLRLPHRSTDGVRPDLRFHLLELVRDPVHMPFLDLDDDPQRSAQPRINARYRRMPLIVGERFDLEKLGEAKDVEDAFGDPQHLSDLAL